MLHHTFAHVPGIGLVTEKSLWSSGVRSWSDALNPLWPACPPRVRADTVRPVVQASLEAYDRRQWRFFDKALPPALKWRAFGDLAAQAHYVDIETSGYDNEITMIGIYDANGFHAYVADQNIEEAREHLENAPLIITFNGVQFDMPLIRARFPYALWNHIHVDVMYPLKKLGLRGGLKRIEQAMGLTRSDETQGLTGWDAVHLWRAWRMGSREALDRLIAYNEEDVRNLAPLMQHVFDTLSAETKAILQAP